jgi:hypothetical protein
MIQPPAVGASFDGEIYGVGRECDCRGRQKIVVFTRDFRLGGTILRGVAHGEF